MPVIVIQILGILSASSGIRTGILRVRRGFFNNINSVRMCDG